MRALTEKVREQMSSITKPKRALLAYCALADRIHNSSAGMFGALVPFFAPICREFSGQMFDAEAFSAAVASLYGMRIPRLAVLGMAEQLEGQGLLVAVVGRARSTVYQYAAVSTGEDMLEVPGVTEREIDAVLHQFVESCRTDPLLADETEQRLQEEFLDRLLNAESMRLLARKETSAAAKASSKTITLKRVESDPKEHRTLRLDFHTAQFLVDLRDSQSTLFDRVSDIAFASMAAEARFLVIPSGNSVSSTYMVVGPGGACGQPTACGWARGQPAGLSIRPSTGERPWRSVGKPAPAGLSTNPPGSVRCVASPVRGRLIPE